jgi:hypothetical protein
MTLNQSLRRIAPLISVFLCFAPDVLSFQEATKTQLAKVKRLKCVFPVHAVGTWKDGEPGAEVKMTNFSLQYESIDAEEGSARVTDRTGPVEITARLAGDNLHLMEILIGALNVTTVFNKPSRAGKLKAVHTRHEYTDVAVPGYTSSPEQYYGECEAER